RRSSARKRARSRRARRHQRSIAAHRRNQGRAARDEGRIAMTLSETCIRRPVMTTLITASFIVFVVLAYSMLPVVALPSLESPPIKRPTTHPAPSAATIPAPVASPIHRQLAAISRVNALTSTSSLGQSSITVQFDLNRNIDGAALDVQTALTVAARKLPV